MSINKWLFWLFLSDKVRYLKTLDAFKNAVNLCRVYAGNDRMKIEPDAFAGDSSVIMIENKGSEIENYAKKYNIGFSEMKETDIAYIPPTRELIF